MSYIGNIPADKYQTLEKQSFSVSATTGYTLSYSVSSPQDIALYINNVRQNPNSSYTVSGTALTLSSATSSGDVMYAVFLGKSVGTIGVPVNGVGTSQLSDDAVTSSKIADSVKLGKIGQVVTATTSTAVTNSSTTYADIGLSASITPSATSSKIYVTAVISNLGTTSPETNVTTQHRILRDTTQVVFYNTARINGIESDTGGSPSLIVLDSPSTASAVTYKVQQRVEVASSRTSISQWNGGASTIVLMEVLA